MHKQSLEQTYVNSCVHTCSTLFSYHPYYHHNYRHDSRVCALSPPPRRLSALPTLTPRVPLCLAHPLPPSPTFPPSHSSSLPLFLPPSSRQPGWTAGGRGALSGLLLGFGAAVVLGFKGFLSKQVTLVQESGNKSVCACTCACVRTFAERGSIDFEIYAVLPKSLAL